MADAAIEALAEDALLVRFGDSIDGTLNARVHSAVRALRTAKLPGVVDIAPAYASLLIRFDPFAQDNDTLLEAITKALSHDSHQGDEQQATTSEQVSARQVEIPVCYGGDAGGDLAAVAAHARLAPAEVIARHTAATYTVAMLGFAPGFPYLLGLDPALHMPRRDNPRTHVPAGSVAIGGAQTGVYPSILPGGWHLIGRTPAVLFDPARDPPCLLAPGDRVRFRAIDADEFAALRGAADAR